jgi:type I restriction enzyme, S subunit
MSWPQSTIEEACVLITDGTHYTPPDVGEGIPFLTVKDLAHDGKIDLVNCAHITEEEFERADNGNSAPKPGDILFSKDGTVGKVYVVESDIRFAVLSSLAILRPDPSRLDSEYFGWVLKTDRCLYQASKSKTGSAIRRIILKDLKRVHFPLPPLSEQRRIAGILDAADALRAKRREALAQLDTLLQSTFLDMFGDPVTNPMGWGVVKFRNLGASRLGKMLDKAKQEGNCQFPYLANFNVQWAGFKLENLRKMDFDADDRVEFELRDGDLLICEGGEVGRTAIWRSQRKNVYFQKALHRVRLDPTKALPEFGQYFMWFMAKNGGFRDFTNSATISHLTGAKLKTLPVPLPPLALQHRFAAIVESVEGQKARMRAHLAELDALFASLQSRAFKGAL